MPENFPSLEHTYITTNGLRLHAVQAGPQAGSHILLLHGFPEFWRGWIRQIDTLAAAGYRVTVPDQRGYNLSDKPAGIQAYHTKTLVADIIGVMDALGQEKITLVGHDWGAMVAWETALRHPQRLEKLVILNVPHPAVMQRFLTSKLHQITKSWYIFFFQIPGLPEWLLRRKQYEVLRRVMHSAANPDAITEADLPHYVEAWRQPGALTGMLNWYRAAFRRSLRALRSNRPQQGQRAALRVSVPTLMLWGVNDNALSQAMAQPSIELCDQGRLVLFEQATHWVQHDQPDEVNAQILAFLDPNSSAEDFAPR